MKNTFGNALGLTIFGESHGAAVGAVLDGLAAAAINSGKDGRVPVCSPSSRRTDWIIHRPIMFLR